MSLLSLVLCGSLAVQVGTPEQILDDFQYSDTPSARLAWTTDEGTPPVEVVAGDSGKAMQIAAPFAARPRQPRAVIDRRVRLDLAAPGEFTLEVATDTPEAIGGITLYFRSGGGWYGASGGLAKKGWHTLHFSKAAFRTEERPAGWDQIDGIRIAAWRGQPKDATLRIRRLAALTHEVAIIVPDGASHGSNGELRSAFDAAETVATVLAELGLGADTVEDTAVVRGALGRRQVAILAYHPRLGGEAEAALVRFVEGGGKVFVCYQLPLRLGAALGFKDPKYARQDRPGQFAEIRFEAADVQGLPRSVHQASWNITVAEPAGYNARVIGRWHDDAGKPTGQAAMLLGDRGAFFSHIVLHDDQEGKKHLLAAVLGKLAPPLWKRMAEAEIARIVSVGHCQDIKSLRDFVLRRNDPAGNPLNRHEGSFRHVELALRTATQAAQRGEYAAAVKQAHAMHESAVRLYLQAAPSLKREARAMWNHSGTGAYPGDWDRTARTLAENGFNMVLPNMLWGGLAHYPSDLLPRSDTLRKHGDQIAQCVDACKKHGIEVHVWKVNYNLLTAPKDFVEKMRRAGRTQVDFRGRAVDWLCPSHPENQKLELESMLEVARKYPVAGLHFDYIRYPGHESCYCDGCRQRFETESGRKVADWPKECHSGARKDEYNDWRCRQITKLVAAVRAEAKKLRAELQISAAVFGAYPDCRRSVAQDWPEWIKAGYLDFVCPMDYSDSDLQFAGWVGNQMKLVGKQIPVYPGIGATASRSALSADRVVGQILCARQLGAGGFCIFNLDRGTLESIVPGVGRGIGRQPAVLPHLKMPGDAGRKEKE